MRKLPARIPTGAVALLLILSVVACASTPTDRILFNTIDDAVTGVQAAVSAFKTAKAHGVIADLDGSKEAKVRAAYSKFQTVAATATDLSVAATTPGQASAALAVAQAAADDALAVINAFKGGTP
jgi:hypothetical protein